VSFGYTGADLPPSGCDVTMEYFLIMKDSMDVTFLFSKIAFFL